MNRLLSMSKQMNLIVAAGLLTALAGGGIARADIPAPKPQAAEPIYADIEVRIDSRAETTKLYVPKQTFTGGERLGQNQSGIRTMVAGIAMTSAVVIGGLVFLRRGGTAAKAGLAAVVAAAVVGVGGTLLADVALPPKPKAAANLGKYVGRTGVEIILTDDGEAAVLVLGQEYARRVQSGPEPQRPRFRPPEGPQGNDE